MCGIAGYAGPATPEQSEHWLRAMVSALAHRGPDSEGIEQWPGALLGHRRLAILDLSPAGHQPMLSEDRRIGVVFNGCIYNFLEIRAELEQLGHRFRSNCDTEVLVNGYRQWGIDSLVRRLRGMYAFAVWDDAERRLTLVRDRLGVKPLLYCASPKGIAFASTAAALRAAGFAGEIDSHSVLEYLEFGYVSEDRTIYAGIAKLPASGIVEWQEGRWTQRTYWSLPEPSAAGPQIGFQEAVEETERLLVEAVRLRLYSDVPIGALLSGGIDSTLVCWAMQKLNANVKAFTVSTPGDPADESSAAIASAQALGIAHEVVTLPGGIL